MRSNDLNLLMIFDAIMTEGAITRAADRLAMTQPAVSNALSRMRIAWKDELFVKDGRGIQPTSFALNLWSQIKGPLGQLEDAVNPSHFDPATARRTFRISASDIIVDMLWGPLRHIIETEAPGINIYAMPNAAANTEKVLNDAEADLVIGKFPMADNVIRSEQILEPSYVCIMRPNHPLAKEELTLQGFADADHLLVSISGDVTGITDQALMNVGLTRRVAMSVNHFHAVAPLLQQSDLICVVPSIAVEKEVFSGKLAVFETPIELAKTPIGVMWHKRQDHDLGLQWLRRLVTQFLRERSDQHKALLSRCCRKGYCPDALKELMAKRANEDCTLPVVDMKRA
ncbi:LysR family transcriptional regulator [Alteromonas sp. ASW11-130]|uniref:LysR family transcriptional regulator n=1 Tax=Alteromonas sp. ASW11-130 TaxID=3015775 RepID=UPI00224283B0|nr:LysR family transcriptional regulator [Alteromonas sp. ASW11-130]MCW8091597.1 LysR family transcriptional regulator [Alteromonas sp. ASW11-130]